MTSTTLHGERTFARTAHLAHPRDEARRIAANIAKLDLLGRGAAASPDPLPGLFGGGSASVTRSNRRKQGGTVPAASRAGFARWQRAANNRRRVAIRQMCGDPSTAAVWEVAARRCRGASGRYDDARGFRQQNQGTVCPKGLCHEDSGRRLLANRGAVRTLDGRKPRRRNSSSLSSDCKGIGRARV